MADGNGVCKASNCSYYLKRRICELFGSFRNACIYAGTIPYLLNTGDKRKKCVVVGCNTPVRSTHCEYCEKHYMRKRRDRKKKTQYHIESNFNRYAFDSPTEDIAWILGLIWTDGNLCRYRTSITSKDVDMLLNVESLLLGNCLVRQRKNPKYYDVILNSRHASFTLRKLGLKESKSLTIEWPVGLDENLVGAFLRGVIDGDGCVSLQDKNTFEGMYNPTLRVSVYTGSTSFAESIKEQYSKHGIRFSIHKRRGRNCYLTTVSVSDTKSLRRLHELIYTKDCPCLQRKRKKFDAWIESQDKKNSANPTGERGWNHKLTWEIVNNLRDAISSGEETRSVPRLAKQYGVSTTTLKSAIKGKTWKKHD